MRLFSGSVVRRWRHLSDAQSISINDERFISYYLFIYYSKIICDGDITEYKYVEFVAKNKCNYSDNYCWEDLDLVFGQIG